MFLLIVRQYSLLGMCEPSLSVLDMGMPLPSSEGLFCTLT